MIAAYAYELAKQYNAYYHDHSILREEDAAVRARCGSSWSEQVARVIRAGDEPAGHRRSRADVNRLKGIRYTLRAASSDAAFFVGSRSAGTEGVTRFFQKMRLNCHCSERRLKVVR
ncbi:MAG: DALR anticodon-binding domain-containing protein [Alistipes shahii]